MTAFTLWHKHFGFKLWAIRPLARLVREAADDAVSGESWSHWRRNGWKVVKIKIALEQGTSWKR